MNSPPLTPLTPARSAPATSTSKRLSLNLSTGPRPLRLVDSNVSSSPGPATAPIISNFPYATLTTRSQRTPQKDASTFNKPNPRRQSSISYRSDPSMVETSRPSHRSIRHDTSRSLSLGHKSGSPLTSPQDRIRPGYETSSKREPLTLAEKHSDLLHSIAQKEAKCLELRSQLGIHEAELLQLKRKWESIVNRGFTNGLPSPNPQSSGAVLEGIREGVQGVSRFIAAGLAIGELSPAQSSSPIHSSGALPSSFPTPNHTSSPSSSSNSTCATKSTRFSQSSLSSVGDSVSLLEKAEEENEEGQILMVHDTGATPTMSPNPAFEHQCQQRKNFAEALSDSIQSTSVREDFLPTSPKNLRRRSKDVCSSENTSLPTRDLSSSSHQSVSAASKGLEAEQRGAIKAKQASVNLTEFPPVSSIPGLASFTMGVTSPQVSSWVGSVGKKWEEIQRGSTFSKSQKRASILLSDVSSSIVSALSSPGASSPKPYPSPPLSTQSYFGPPATTPSPLTASTTSTSLLDADDFVLSTSPVLIPDFPPPTTTTSRKPKHDISSSRADALVDTKLDDEEWNW